MNTFDKLAALSKESMEDIIPKDSGKWAYAFNKDSESWTIEDSKESALEEGKACAEDSGYDHVYLAPAAVPAVPEICGSSIVDLLVDASCEYMPEEAQFLDGVTSAQEEELSALVNNVILSWIKKHDLYPKWYQVDMDKIEEVEVPEEK